MHVWIVERKMNNNCYRPIMSQVWRSREMARVELRVWLKMNCPDTTFRIVKYTSENVSR